MKNLRHFVHCITLPDSIFGLIGILCQFIIQLIVCIKSDYFYNIFRMLLSYYIYLLHVTNQLDSKYITKFFKRFFWRIFNYSFSQHIYHTTNSRLDCHILGKIFLKIFLLYIFLIGLIFYILKIYRPSPLIVWQLIWFSILNS